MKLQLKFTSKDTEYYKTWFSFYPKRNRYSPFRLKVERYGYFDPRPQLITSVTSVAALLLPLISIYFLPMSVFFMFFGWGDIYLNLPINTGMGDECDSPEYGISTFSSDNRVVNEFWTYWGKKRKHMQLPWSFKRFRTSLLLKSGEWVHETKGNSKEFWRDEWKNKAYKIEYPYDYKLKSGDVQEVIATVTVQEREWRRYWLPFSGLFNRVDKSIEVEFSSEVGERTGSWKGGVIGCGYTMIKGETALDTIKRMEKERKFN